MEPGHPLSHSDGVLIPAVPTATQPVKELLEYDVNNEYTIDND